MEYRSLSGSEENDGTFWITILTDTTAKLGRESRPKENGNAFVDGTNIQGSVHIPPKINMYIIDKNVAPEPNDSL